MAHQGQAADYYSQDIGQAPYQQQGYQQQYPPPNGPPQGYAQPYAPPQQPYQPQEPKYGMQPPTYGQNFVPPQDDKQSFQETFKIQKPKFNDLWAGLLVSLPSPDLVSLQLLMVAMLMKHSSSQPSVVSLPSLA